MNFLFKWRAAALLALIVLGALVLALLPSFFVHTPAAASSGASLTLSTSIGPPTTMVQLTGSGFGTAETVSLTFDTALLGTTLSSASGTFSISEKIPRAALPGTHTVQALGGTSQRSAQASFLVQTNWAVDGFNAQRTHANPFENVLSRSNVSRLVLDWQYQTQNALLETSPIIVNGIVYISSTDTFLYALDAQSGALKWSQKLGPMLTTPAVANGVIYVGSEYGTIYALDATTGVLKWSRSLGGTMLSAPVVVGGVIYTGSLDFNMYALNATTGTVKWSKNLGTSVGSAVAVSNNVVYAGLASGHVVALNARTGALIWDASVSLNAIGGELVVANGLVYATSDSLFAIDASTGALVWYDLVSYPSASYSVAVADGMLFAGLGSNTFYAFNALTGQVLWTYVAGSVIIPSPTVANKVVYFCSSDGNLYAFDARQGTKLWSDAGNFALSSPSIVNGVVYVGSFNGALDTFHLPSP